MELWYVARLIESFRKATATPPVGVVSSSVADVLIVGGGNSEAPEPQEELSSRGDFATDTSVDRKAPTRSLPSHQQHVLSNMHFQLCTSTRQHGTANRTGCHGRYKQVHSTSTRQ